MARLVDRLRAYIKQRRARRRRRRKQQREFARWLADNPGGTYGHFYAADARRRIDAGGAHTTLGIDSVDQEAVIARAGRVLGDFKRAGCTPEHVVVDYGCGSLWIGEAFIDYLQPDKYIGLDISDVFFAERLAQLPRELLAQKRPSVQVISDAALQAVRDRKPDFILSVAVLRHVPPEDLRDYFRHVLSLAAPHSRIEICHSVHFRTTWMPPRSWRHSRYAIRAALAPLGYAAEYRPEGRIMPTTPGFSIVRR